MPPPRIVTVLPAPTLAGQSPGLGDMSLPGGGGGAGGAGGWAGPDDAEDEPQAARDVVMPMAAIVRSTAEPPTVRPIAVRNSRRAMRTGLLVIGFLPRRHFEIDYTGPTGSGSKYAPVVEFDSIRE